MSDIKPTKSSGISININQYVTFRLTDTGEQILADYNNTTRAQHPNLRNYSAGKFDEDSLCCMQLWEVMSIFGPHLHLTAEPPFKDCEITLVEHGAKVSETSQSVITTKRYGVYGRNSFGNQIAQNFTAVREEKGMTQEEAAKGMGLPVSAIYMSLEGGVTVPTLDFLTSACEFYRCTPNDILMQETDGE